MSEPKMPDVNSFNPNKDLQATARVDERISQLVSLPATGDLIEDAKEYFKITGLHYEDAPRIERALENKDEETLLDYLKELKVAKDGKDSISDLSESHKREMDAKSNCFDSIISTFELKRNAALNTEVAEE